MKHLIIISAVFLATLLTYSQPIEQKIFTGSVDVVEAQKTCPDLQLRNIHFLVLKKTAPLVGRVRIQVIVENMGDMDFEARTGQAWVELYEHHPGGKPTLIKIQKWTHF